MKLHIEMIPQTCWGVNLRTMLKESDWDKIRKDVYAKEKMCCHICNIQCETLEAHEIWEFSEKKHIQRLVEVIGICKACHSTIHYGLAQRLGHEKEAKEHFIAVNNCEEIDFKKEIIKAEGKYNVRSSIKDWKLDLTFIENQGYAVKKINKNKLKNNKKWENEKKNIKKKENWTDITISEIKEIIDKDFDYEEWKLGNYHIPIILIGGSSITPQIRCVDGQFQYLQS
jgi:hypothetical protein